MHTRGWENTVKIFDGCADGTVFALYAFTASVASFPKPSGTAGKYPHCTYFALPRYWLQLSVQLNALLSRRKNNVIHYNRGCVSTRSVLDMVLTRHILTPWKESNPGSKPHSLTQFNKKFWEELMTLTFFQSLLSTWWGYQKVHINETNQWSFLCIIFTTTHSNYVKFSRRNILILGHPYVCKRWHKTSEDIWCLCWQRGTTRPSVSHLPRFLVLAAQPPNILTTYFQNLQVRFKICLHAEYLMPLSNVSSVIAITPKAKQPIYFGRPSCCFTS
jgi:hypothetical protein